MNVRFSAVALVLSLGCTPSKPAAKRANLEQVGPASVKLVPAENQPANCLVFTVSQTGVVRQLTMNPANASVACPAGKPIGGVPHRIPPEEGKVRIHAIFSDRVLDATPMAMQIQELAGNNPNFGGLDLRAPGQISVETLEFTPSFDAEEITVQAPAEDGRGRP